jgi:small-conductance mechanosensitive channel
MKKICIITLIVLVANSLHVFSQNNSGKDSIARRMTDQSETAILYQQRIMDSLVKESLKNQLQLATGDSRKTKELEEKLSKLEAKDSLSRVEMMKKISLLKKTAKGYAVAPFHDTLFLVYNGTATFNASERAENINSRIKKIYDDPFFNPDSVKVTKTDVGTAISYNNDIIVTVVTKIDALLIDKDQYQLAVEYRNKIVNNIIFERNANSLTRWLIRIGLVLLIIAGLWLIIYLIKRTFTWLNTLFISNIENLIAILSLKKFKIVTPEHFEKFGLRLSNLLKIIVIIVTVYLALPLLFSIFPETKMWTTTLLTWILSPARNALNGVINFLPDLFSIIVIVLIFRYVIKGIKYFVDQLETGQIEIKGLYPDWAQPTFRILKFLLYAFMLVLLFPFLPGSNSDAFKGVSVFIGILFSLGSSSAIANMVAGLVITYMRPFKTGDRVKIGEITGDVMEKTLLVTRIRTVKNEDITVPNSTVLLSSTTNYSANTGPEGNGLIVHTTVTIGYDVPWKDMHRALINAALRTDMVLKNPAPFVLQTSLDDFYVSYQINAYTREANKQAQIYSLLHQNIQDCCNEAGIEILSPHYRNQRDGNMTTIPANYLKDDYETPAFNVKQVKEK